MPENKKALVDVNVNVDGEAVKPIVKETNKLLDKISNVTGIVFGPYKEKQKSKINFLEEINKREDLSSFEKMAITSNYKKMLKEYNNQTNIVNKAVEMLSEPIEQHELQELDENWIMNYMDCCKNICDEELQVIWAKILAGEFEQPGRISLNTLDKMKMISKKDAELFMKISEFIMRTGNKYFILADKEILEKYDIIFEDIIALDEIGLINQKVLSLDSLSESNELNAIYKDKYVFFKRKEGHTHLPVYVITSFGREVYDLLEVNNNNMFLEDWAKKNKTIYDISYRIIIKEENKTITCNDEVIKLN